MPFMARYRSNTNRSTTSKDGSSKASSCASLQIIPEKKISLEDLQAQNLKDVPTVTLKSMWKKNPLRS